jgi:hypothetical protein
MTIARKNVSALVVWSMPLLLILLAISLVGGGKGNASSKASRKLFPEAIPTQASVTNQNSVAGTLDITNPQQMIPVPHPGRWYLRTSNTTSAQLVCAHFSYSITTVFVEGLNNQCQVVLIAMHLPLTTSWELDAA